jgi:hypothetical protein
MSMTGMPLIIARSVVGTGGRNVKTAQWKVYTPGLVREILSNDGTEILRMPLQIFMGILYKVAERASELNDPELNRLMLRLALYAIADPKSKSYDPKEVSRLLDEI